MSNLLKKLVLFIEVCRYHSICPVIYLFMDSGSLMLVADILLQDDMCVCMYLSLTEVFCLSSVLLLFNTVRHLRRHVLYPTVIITM